VSGEPVRAGDLPIGFFGGPRYLPGFERQVTLFYDDPDLHQKRSSCSRLPCRSSDHAAAKLAEARLSPCRAGYQFTG